MEYGCAQMVCRSPTVKEVALAEKVRYQNPASYRNLAKKTVEIKSDSH